MECEISQDYIIGKSRDAVFDALITPGMIKKWLFANNAIVLPEEGGVYALTWGDEIDNPETISVAKISRLRKLELLLLRDFRYRSKNDPLTFDDDIAVQFTLEQAGSKTKLTVNQRGFPFEMIVDEFYNGCVQGWIITIASSKTTVEENENFVKI